MLKQFLRWVDSESLRPSQAVLYFAFWVSGVQMAISTTAESIVARELGHFTHWAWVALLLICPPMVLIGYRMHDQYAGLLLQFGGNLAITAGLFGFCAAIIASGPDTSSFALGMGLAAGAVTSMISLRDIRRLRFVSAVAEEMNRDKNDT